MSLVLIIVAAGVLGRLIMQRLRIGRGPEAWTCAFLVGMSGCAVIVLNLGSASLAWAQTALGALALGGLIWELFLYSRRARPPETGSHDAPAAPLNWFEGTCLAAAGLALILALVGALAPVTSWEAAAAHIALPADYARAGRIALQPGNVWSGHPHLMQALYAAAYYEGGEKPVTLLNWCFAVLACGAAYGLGARLGGRRCGMITAAILATAPIFLNQAGNVSIDLAFAAMATAALSALLAHLDTQRRGWLIAAALLAGSSCGIRHTGLLVCALLGIGMLTGSAAARGRAAALFLGTAALAAAPWLLRSALVVGNPLFPLFTGLFPTQSLDHVAPAGPGAHESIVRSGGLRLVEFIRFPWDIVMRPGRYDGWSQSPGVLVLALGIPGFLVGRRRARAVGLYAVAGGMFFFFFMRLARFLLPFFIPMMALAGFAAVRLRPLSRPIAALLLAAFLYGLTLHTLVIQDRISVVLGMETKEEHLRRRVERYEAFRYVNRFCNDGGVVLTVDPRTYFLDPPAFQNPATMKRLPAMTPDAQRDWLRAHRIKYVLMPVDFVRESPAHADLTPLFHAWRTDPAHFRLVQAMHLPRLRGEGLETVEIYKVLSD